MAYTFAAKERPIRVALAGLGTVGLGVYERLARLSDAFEIVGILCRNPDAHSANGAPTRLLTDDPSELATHDIFVEAIGGVGTAKDVVLAALARGADVVTANKTLTARHFSEIEAARAKSGAAFLYSAAVGGGVPMLETVDDIAAKTKVTAIEAVLNGTTNFILDRLGGGAALDAAIREAQAAGFAEADPSADINGVDAAEKLSLLVRRAFGFDVHPDDIPADRLAGIASESVAAAAARGAPLKQVAHAEVCDGRLSLSVRLKSVEPGGPLARPVREENTLVVTSADGRRTVVHGKGAGRIPTAASVFGDIETAVAKRRFAVPI